MNKTVYMIFKLDKLRSKEFFWWVFLFTHRSYSPRLTIVNGLFCDPTYFLIHKKVSFQLIPILHWQDVHEIHVLEKLHRLLRWKYSWIKRIYTTIIYKWYFCQNKHVFVTLILHFFLWFSYRFNMKYPNYFKIKEGKSCLLGNSLFLALVREKKSTYTSSCFPNFSHAINTRFSNHSNACHKMHIHICFSFTSMWRMHKSKVCW